VDGISHNTHLSHYQILSRSGLGRSGDVCFALDIAPTLSNPAVNRTSTIAPSFEEQMHNLKRILVVCIAVVLSTICFGQQNQNEFKTFWEKFKTAVINSDKNAVASLSKFPIGMSYGIRSIKSKPELLRRYKEVFSTQTDAAKCFAAKQPEQENPRKYTVACPDAGGNEVVIYEFERGAAGWKFVRLDNINE
jgi:hypothetical protein